MKGIVCMVLLSLVLLSTAALAGVPDQISYQGTLTDTYGVALDTTVSMTFGIYADSMGFLPLWSETQPAVEVAAGLFDVLLGSVTPLANNDFPGPPVWLKVQVGADPPLSPLQKLVSVGYAFRAAEADTADYARNGGGSAADGDWTIVGNNMYSTVSGDVGIGTTSPAAKLDVGGDVNSDSLYRIKDSPVLAVPGLHSVLVGVDAGRNNTGDYATFLGRSTGYNNTGSSNTFLGHYAGNDNTAGSYNTFVGRYAGAGNTTGGSNVYLGYAAGYNNSTGGNNIFIGSFAGYHETGSNKLYIANYMDTSDVLIYGDFSSGNVGLGTLSPVEKLHVLGNVRVANDLFTDGNVGIGTLSPATRLGVNGVVTAAGGNSDQWNTAHGWGDHALENYLKLETINMTSSTTGLSSASALNVLNISGNSPYATLFVENNYPGDTWALSAGCFSASAGSSSYGVNGFNYGEGFAVHGASYHIHGIGVRGINDSSSAFGDLGRLNMGVYGQYDSDTYGVLGGTSYGAFGQGMVGTYGYVGLSGYGIYGKHVDGNYGYIASPEYGMYGKLVTANVGDYAIYGYGVTTSGADGTDYTVSGTIGGVKGYNYLGNIYTFGVAGYSNLNYNRSGGCFGGKHNAGVWGCYGYKNSGGTEYGGYATSWGSGTGKGDQAALGIGLGAWGELFGADIHGKVYGAFVEGGSYSLYSHGAVFMDDLNIHLQHTDDNTTSVLYANVSTDVTVQTSGFASLYNGKSTIAFDRNFRGAVSPEVPIVVTVTPTGPCQGVYVSQVTKDGFTVVENNAGKSSVQVAFIAVGRRAGYEDPQLPGEVISPDYVHKLSRGLHNDTDTQTNGEGLYFENGELVVGVHPSTLSDPIEPREESTGIEPVQPPRPRVLPEELSDNNGKAPERVRRVMEEK